MTSAGNGRSAVSPHDVLEIHDSIIVANDLLDSGQIDQLVNRLFVVDRDDLEPEVDCGFARWRGATEIRDGYRLAMSRFVGVVHLTSDLRVQVETHEASAVHHVQAWHWLPSAVGGPTGAADFVTLGRMTDRFVRTSAGWRVRSRRLERLGPGVAAGSLPTFLAGLGEA